MLSVCAGGKPLQLAPSTDAHEAVPDLGEAGDVGGSEPACRGEHRAHQVRVPLVGARGGVPVDLDVGPQ